MNGKWSAKVTLVFAVTIFAALHLPLDCHAVTLGEAVDNTSLTWTTGGDASWFPQTSYSRSGGSGAQAGAIGHNGRTWLQTTLTGSATVSFYWRVSSETGHDRLSLLIDGVPQSGGISGTREWEKKEYAVGAGTHTLRWEYAKDNAGSANVDSGWLDQVVVGRTMALSVSPPYGSSRIAVTTPVSAAFSDPVIDATFALKPRAIQGIAAGKGLGGSGFTVVAKGDGTVAAWGSPAISASIPVGLADVATVDAGLAHAVALKRDGTVVAWGDNSYGQTTVPGGLEHVVAVSAGQKFTVALKADGTVTAWGDNSYGQTSVPQGLSGVIAISAGNFHVAAVKRDGTVVVWGDNGAFQRELPPGLADVAAVAAGGYHTVALKGDGTVAAWGGNGYGQSTIPDGLAGVVAIAAGENHSVALKDDGSVVAWGISYGQFHKGQTSIPPGLANVVAVAAGGLQTVALQEDGTLVSLGDNGTGPAKIPADLNKVVAVATGPFHTLALKSSGIPVAWGQNMNGQCSFPAGLSGVVGISAGQYHSVALKRDGTVAAWGSNSNGQTAVPGGLANVVAISAGAFHSLALKGDGTVAAWGGTGGYNFNQSAVPAGLGGVVAVAAGSYHSLALKNDGTVVAWGDNTYGEAPPSVAATGVVAIAAGAYHSAAVKSDGTVVTWGQNYVAPPATATNVIAVGAGTGFTTVLKADGTVVAWGNNAQNKVPAGLNNVVAISVSGFNTVALKGDGSVVAWGDDNSAGQLDLPSIAFASIPGYVDFDASSSIATFTPTSTLAHQTAYTASVAAISAMDYSAAAPTAWSFSTRRESVPPTGSMVINGGDASTLTTEVSLALSVTEDPSGVCWMQFSSDGTNWGSWEPFSTTRAYSLPAGNGLKTVFARFRDMEGNVSPVYSDTITLGPLQLDFPVNITIIGNGAVVSNPAGIDCPGSSCSSLFPRDSSVILTATAPTHARFGGWSGCDSATGPQCSLSMTAAKNVSATFTCSDVYSGGQYYCAIRDVYSIAADPVTINLVDGEMYEAVILDRPISCRLSGGFDADFTGNSGMTSLHGSLRIVNGSAVVDRIRIR